MTAERRKVLLVAQYLHMGGLERMVFGLASALKTGGQWEPRAFVFDRLPGAAPENDLRPDFAAAGIATTARFKRPGFSPRTALALARTLSAGGIRVLHTHDLGPLIYGALAKRMSFGRVRLVHTQHSFVGLAERGRDRRYLRFFARFADELVAVSEDTRRSFVALGVPPEKVRVIPNGVRFPERAISGGRRRKEELLDSLAAPLRAELAPFLDSRWILYLARVHRTKGQDRALELWSRLAPRVRAGSALLFVGPESDDGRLAKLRRGISAAPDSSRILYMGTAHEPERWRAASDLALSCSEFEGMPLGPIEAAGAGLPQVLSRIPGHAILADVSAQYPLDQPEQGALLVAKALDECDAGPADYFRRAWERGAAVRARFTLARMTEAYARLYAGTES